jgi:hypothetical protein
MNQSLGTIQNFYGSYFRHYQIQGPELDLHKNFLKYIGLIHPSLKKYTIQKSNGKFDFGLDPQFAHEVFVFLESRKSGVAQITSMNDPVLLTRHQESAGHRRNINHSLISQIPQHNIEQLVYDFVGLQKEKIDAQIDTHHKNAETQNRLVPQSSVGFVTHFGVKSDARVVDPDRRRREYLFHVPHTHDYEEHLKKLGYGVKRKHRLTYSGE